ncbi:MAG: hypothetical protein WA625_08335, partial [Pseudolabrys sp.]
MARPWCRAAALATLIFTTGSSVVAQQLDVPRSTVPSAMPRIGTIDQRYQAYNIEMVEVTGGKFWKPYSSLSSSVQRKSGAEGGDTPVGMDSNLFEYRPPINLSSRRLRVLAAALSPTYLRVSGTWANSTYLESSDEHLTQPPEGFSHLLTQEQWNGVVEFSRAVSAPIVTSFATSSGTRDLGGIWTSHLGLRVLDYTRLLGGTIAAAEFMNEPTLAVLGGAPKGYDAEAYGKDFRVFHAFARDKAPEM